MAPTKSTRPASPERPAALGAKVKTVKGLGPVKGAGVAKRSRQHRSGRTTGRIASLPPGPPPPPRWYQETERSTIPVAIQHRLVASCHVDFLDNGLGGTNNCAMRLMFTNPQTHATKHAPAGTRGIIIRFMRSDGGAGPAGGLVPFGGMLRYQPIGYLTPHPQAAHNFAVPVVPGMRVRDFMRVVNANNMLPAEFSSLAADTVGCRDFTGFCTAIRQELWRFRLQRPPFGIISILFTDTQLQRPKGRRLYRSHQLPALLDSLLSKMTPTFTSPLLESIMPPLQRWPHH
ncbi:unnamed protein product [Penicillium olsonii]|nr:unnamed protein product [Penicillium olsonii]CAG7934061.1 unnamed protein product [Penicillium olsonii]